MKVAEVMTRKVNSVAPSDDFPKLLTFLITKKISGAPVVDEKGRVVGVISEKDLFFKLFPSQKEFYKNLEYYMNYKNIEANIPKLRKFRAKDLMSKKVISVTPDANILKACSLFILHPIRRLPVIDKGKLVGIVTTKDIYRNFLKNLV